MPEWLLTLMGIELPPLPPGARRYLEWAGLPQGEKMLFLLLFGGALIGGVSWFYRREGSAPSWQKISLAALRVLVIILALVIFCEPRLAVEIANTEQGSTLVLLDDSQSMALKDRIDDPALRARVARGAGIQDYDIQSTSRAQIVEKILNNKELRLLDRLAESNPTLVFRFGSGLQEIERKAGDPIELKARSQATNLTAALRGALERAGQNKVATAGIVIFSDGRHNVGQAPDSLAALLKQREVKVFTVGVGNPLPPKNFEVVELLANPRVYKNDPVLFQGRVRATGLDGETFTVTLERTTRSSGQTEKVGELRLTAKGARFEAPVEFQVKPDQAGEFLFSLKIEPRDDELTDADNAASKPLEVIDDDTRVLLISGAPTFEFQRLRNLLIRERTVQVSCWLQTADDDFPQDGNVRIDRLPRTQEELFKYDVIVMMDPRVDELDRGWLELVKAFVERHGGGLCFIAGDKHSAGIFASADCLPLQQILPVQVDGRSLGFLEPGKRYRDEWSIKLTADGQDHAVTRLSGNAEELKAIWARLPGLYWSFPIQREKPGAAVLLRSQNPERVSGDGAAPLLIAHFYGPGRTVFQAFDSSWRWRTISTPGYDRYWVQMIRYLVEGRLLGGQRQISVQTDKDSYDLGDLVNVRVRVLDRSFRPLSNARLVGLARNAEGADTEVRFTEIPGREGSYLGSFVPEQAGLVKIEVDAPDLVGAEGSSRVSKDIRITLPNLEFAETSLDKGLLSSLAELSGGRSFELDELDQLPALIPPRRETIIVSGSPIALWDTRLSLIVLTLLLSLEWWFRKRCRMV